MKPIGGVFESLVLSVKIVPHEKMKPASAA
jgi:hypothetical protein